MAFYTQSFDSLTSADLDGQDSWSNTNSPLFANQSVQSTVKYRGAKGVYLNGYSVYSRSIGSNTTGTQYFAMRVKTSNAAGDGPFIQIRNATQYAAIIKAVVDSGQLKLQYYTNGSYVNLQNISLDTWYVIGIDLDQPNNRYRYSVNNGAWSSYVTQGTSGAGACDRINMGQDALWEGYVDEYDVSYPALPATNPAFLLNMV